MPRVRTRSFLRTLILSVSVFTLAVGACSDLPTAPTEQMVEVTPQDGLIDGLLGVVGGVLKTVTGILSPVLGRDEPLEQDEVVIRTIGRDGGTIRLPNAGLTVTIPRGALSSDTRITVRAPAGDLLGYEFAPHGLQFNKPVTLTQEVTSQQVANGLEAIYFDGNLQPTVEVLEVLPVSTLRATATWRIEHFSGYAMRQRGYVVATN
jgi:hypothetical protein